MLPTDRPRQAVEEELNARLGAARTRYQELKASLPDGDDELTRARTEYRETLRQFTEFITRVPLRSYQP